MKLKKIISLFLGLIALILPTENLRAATDLARQLSGRILLQVESHGEAWYVNPIDLKRYYLGRPADAFQVMRQLGLGISNTNLSKIPENNSSYNGDWSLRKRLSGRILLQVESHGEAWYVNPINLKRYYLGRPADAFNLMRSLGLGISNNNLANVPIYPTSTNPSLPSVNWGSEIRLSSDDFRAHKAYTNARTIIAGGETIHAVWYETRSGNDEIHYRRSINNGLSWENDRVLTSGPNFINEVTLTTESGREFQVNNSIATNPAIAASGSNIYIVWRSDFNSSRIESNKFTNGEIYFKKSGDGGATWGADTRLTNASGDSTSPSIFADGNNVYVVWFDSRGATDEIYFKRSTDNGLTWSDDLQITNNSGLNSQPTIATNGNNVLLFWMDRRNGNWEIYYKRSTDGGATWSAATRFTNNEGVSEVPSIARSGNNFYVVWTDSRSAPGEHYIDAYDIYYRKSTDGGATWSSERQLTDAPKWSADASIAVYGENVYIVWPDRRDQAGSGRENDHEIYFKYSVDGGATWSADSRLTNSPNSSSLASIDATSSKIHILWEDEKTGVPGIYYKNASLNP